MGIDIRDGDQLECINCGLCIDACDSIMAKIERPKGLIAYDSGANLDRRVAGGRSVFLPIRARTIYYGAALTIVAAIMLFGLSTRSVLDINVLRDRNPNFVVLSDGAVRNGYEVKVLNKMNTDQDYRLQVTGPTGLSLRVIGQEAEPTSAVLHAQADTVVPYRIFVTVPAQAIDAPSLPVTFTLTNVATGDEVAETSMIQTGWAS